MMISKLYSFLFDSSKSYEQNLQTLLELIKNSDENSLIVASEVCFSGYDYDNFDEMVEFSAYATAEVKKVSTNKIIILTMLERDDGKVYNFAKIFYNGKVVYKQAKAKLFKFGQEHHYMEAGDVKDINIVEVAGLKIGILICFEIRFKELWQRLEGADIIAIPAWWGKPRFQNFKTLTQALAIMNQCYVVASDSSHKECTALSGIITPFGEDRRNETKSSLMVRFDAQEIAKMRRYMDVGIK